MPARSASRSAHTEWPVLNVVLSLFSWHNETINVWTHLLGFMLFFDLTLVHLGQYFTQVAGLIGHLSCLPELVEFPTVINGLHAYAYRVRRPHLQVTTHLRQFQNTNNTYSAVKSGTEKLAAHPVNPEEPD